MKFENTKLKLEYNDNWEEIKDKIPNRLLILDNKNNKSRIMLMEQKNQAVNLDFLKSAVEIFPRNENLKIEKSSIEQIGNKNIHKLVAKDERPNNTMKTITISLINKTDVYIFNYISFDLNDNGNELDKIVKTLEFKKT